MPKFRKKSIAVEASLWFKNGDRPLDYSKTHVGYENNNIRTFSPDERYAARWEGDIVRYFRHPEILGSTICSYCGQTMHVHGWIDSFKGKHIVCPGDCTITEDNMTYYPCHPEDFEQQYELDNEEG